MVERFKPPKGPKEPKKKKTAKSIELIENLKKAVGNDLNHLLFNENTRNRKHAVYIIGVLFEDGWFHVIHPGQEIGIQLANRMKKELEDSIRKDVAEDTESPDET